jgi:hypothetical protein
VRHRQNRRATQKPLIPPNSEFRPLSRLITITPNEDRPYPLLNNHAQGNRVTQLNYYPLRRLPFDVRIVLIRSRKPRKPLFLRHPPNTKYPYTLDTRPVARLTATKNTPFRPIYQIPLKLRLHPNSEYPQLPTRTLPNSVPKPSHDLSRRRIPPNDPFTYTTPFGTVAPPRTPYLRPPALRLPITPDPTLRSQPRTKQ